MVNQAAATRVAQAKAANGEDNETYDFYLLLKSDHMQGWALPESVKEK